jgi:hypothetical protein
VEEVGKMIVVEGYKAFRGVLIVWQRVNGMLCNHKRIHGEWLYKPETGCWYGGVSPTLGTFAKLV